MRDTRHHPTAMKTRLRSEKMLERLNHHPEKKKLKDDCITKKLSQLAEFKKAGTILFYLPIHGEVDLRALFGKFALNKKFILPRVKDEKTLHLFHIDNLEDTEPGSFKIPEPKLHLPGAAASEIELALVPGIAFGKNGHRIGYGKGFYDRLLKKLGCPKIGIAYDFQMVENIPAERHDTPMDIIVTEKRILRIGKKKSNNS